MTLVVTVTKSVKVTMSALIIRRKITVIIIQKIKINGTIYFRNRIIALKKTELKIKIIIIYQQNNWNEKWKMNELKYLIMSELTNSS